MLQQVTPLQDRINQAVDYLTLQLNVTPEMVVIAGSGLAGLADLVDTPIIIDYRSIPHFRESTAPGHAGKLYVGEIAGKNVICMQGRLHMYEGNTAEEIVFPLEVFSALGARLMVVTNAAGAVNENFQVGDIMLITDHINLMGANPLTLGAKYGLPDFLDMTRAYSPALLTVARQVAARLTLVLREGVYLGVRGPNFETPAEIRAFRTLGADAVGMSTVFEVLAANKLNMQTLGFSLITNMAAGILDRPLSGQEVIQTAAFAGASMLNLVCGIIEEL